MSPSTSEASDRRRSRWAAVQPMMLLWLTLVWVLLWRDLSAANVLGGLALAVAVTLAFPMPRLRLGTRLRPLALAWLLAHFLYDVVKASFQVAWLTLQLRRQPRSAVIAVQLRSRSDLVMTLVAEAITLVPGSLAVEARRHTSTLYAHVLDLGDHDVEHFRRSILAQEHRIRRALGDDRADETTFPEADPGTPGGRP